MAYRINLYLFRQLTTAFLFACIAVSFVVLFTQSFRLLSFVIDNASSTGVFFQLMGLMIPTFLPLILPISFGVAVLFVYHKFAVDSELVVLRAAGLSPVRLAAPALALAGALIVLGGVLTLWATPAANRALVSLQYRIRDNFSAAMIRPGVFNDVAEGLTLFSQRRDGNGRLENLLLHDVRNPARPVTIMAKGGLFSMEQDQPQILVFHGRRQEVDVASGRLQQLNFDRYALDLNILKDEKPDRQQDPREVSLIKLWSAGSDPGLSYKSVGRVRAEIHQRLASPLLSLTFALIAVTVILVGDFNRRGMTKRVVTAALFIIVVQAAMLGLVSQIGRSAFFVPVLYLVVLLPVPFCLWLLRRKTLAPPRLPLFWLERRT